MSKRSCGEHTAVGWRRSGREFGAMIRSKSSIPTTGSLTFSFLLARRDVTIGEVLAFLDVVEILRSLVPLCKMARNFVRRGCRAACVDLRGVRSPPSQRMRRALDALLGPQGGGEDCSAGGQNKLHFQTPLIAWLMLQTGCQHCNIIEIELDH